MTGYAMWSHTLPKAFVRKCLFAPPALNALKGRGIRDKSRMGSGPRRSHRGAGRNPGSLRQGAFGKIHLCRTEGIETHFAVLRRILQARKETPGFSHETTLNAARPKPHGSDKAAEPDPGGHRQWAGAQDSVFRVEGRRTGFRNLQVVLGKRQKVLRLAQALRFKAAKRTSATSTNPAGASVRRRAHGARAGVQARRVHHT